MRSRGGPGIGIRFQPSGKPGEDGSVHIEARVAQGTFPDLRVGTHLPVGAMRYGGDYRVLIGGSVLVANGSCMVEKFQVRSDGHVVPGGEPQRRYTPTHVLVVEAA